MSNVKGLTHFVTLCVLWVLFVYAQYHYISLSIPVRDGKYLAADLYATDTLIHKPTILIQTPYNKNKYHHTIGNPETQVPYDSVNYNYVVVDWRGFHGSVAAESLGYDRGLDGYDIIEWISTRSWSNGKVGTWGPSALGIIQFQTAKHRPPHLYGSIPIVASYKTTYTDYYYGGDYLKELTKMRDSLGFVAESLILAHYKYDLFWIVFETVTDRPESINVPMLLITGWYDHGKDAPLQAFYGLKTESDTLVRNKHKFIVGPWTHARVGNLNQGELTYPNAVDTPRVASLRFFDYYMRNVNNGYDNEPVVRYYQLGENMWQGTNDWVSLSNKTDTLYLDMGGLLSPTPPQSAMIPDSFLYDPHDPSPSIGGIRFDPFDPSVIVGPRDQSDSIENRSDVLIYTTPVLSQNLIINGNIMVKLYISSNREDTDFSIRLTDVYPDGHSMLVTEGIRRMRFRNSYSSEQLIVPGDTDSVFIELQNIAYTFQINHRLRLIVSSSDFPIFDINLNNGDTLYKPGDTLIATNKIYHDLIGQSMLILKTIKPVNINERPIMENRRSSFIVNQTVFNQRVDIEFNLATPAFTILKIYNVMGREIATLVNKHLAAGSHKVDFDGLRLSSGVYFPQLITDGAEIATSKIIFIK